MTTRTLTVPLLLLLFFLRITRVHALISLNHARSSSSRRGGWKTLLHVSSDDAHHDEEGDVGAFRQHMEEIWLEENIYPWDSEDEEIPDWLSAVAASSCIGEDCEECLIPDMMYNQQQKQTSSSHRQQDADALSRDVMKFLGIRRAEPIRVPQRQSSSSSS